MVSVGAMGTGCSIGAFGLCRCGCDEMGGTGEMACLIFSSLILQCLVARAHGLSRMCKEHWHCSLANAFRAKLPLHPPFHGVKWCLDSDLILPYFPKLQDPSYTCVSYTRRGMIALTPNVSCFLYCFFTGRGWCAGHWLIPEVPH